MSDGPQRSYPSNDQASDHIDKLDVAHSDPSHSRSPQSPRPPVVRIRHSTQQDTRPLLRFPLTGDPNPEYLPNDLNAQMILACTIIGVQVNLLTSSTLPLTPLILTTLGLVLELTGAVLVVGHIQPQPRPQAAHGVEQTQTPLDASAQRPLPTAFILMGIVMFTAAVILTPFSIQTA